MLGKNLLIITGATLSGASLAIILFLVGFDLNVSHALKSQAWNLNAIGAEYVHSELKQIDPGKASLLLTYDLENRTDKDYRLTEKSSTGELIIMSRLKSDGSLSQEDPIRLTHPVYLPAGQKVRISIEVLHPFIWPAYGDPATDEKLKNFVRERLGNVAGFVLFDETNHCEVELPRSWDALNVAARGKN